MHAWKVAKEAVSECKDWKKSNLSRQVVMAEEARATVTKETITVYQDWNRLGLLG